MKRVFCAFFAVLFLISTTGCGQSSPPPEPSASEEPLQTSTATEPPATFPAAPPPIQILPPPSPARQLSPREKEMLLKIAMAERGHCGCTECIALVMCTVLNRLDSGEFGSSLEVILSPEQFTPVEDGSYDTARPNENCYDALEMVLYGWDESQGALYYEWHKTETWHSRNLPLLFTHCDVKFYGKMENAS